MFLDTCKHRRSDPPSRQMTSSWKYELKVININELQSYAKYAFEKKAPLWFN
jgi:hypothetical protein